MANQDYAKGRCLCGFVSISVESLPGSVGACHCSMCRRWAGGPLFAIMCDSNVRLDGEENISIYNSSDWAERGFCSHCGSHLFYRLKETGQYVLMPGLFDETCNFVFDHQIFIDEKPSYYAFANKTQDMTGAEVFAANASKE